MKVKLVLFFLIIIGFFYRAYGLGDNHSFWSDEAHVAIFTRAILERGKPVLDNGFSTGAYQFLLYWLGAISAKIFGLSEFSIRFPSLIFGVITIWAVYLLGKELFNKNIGLVASVFITFLNIEILWSRQARPYQALQFFYVLAAWFIYKFTKEEKPDWRFFLGFLLGGLLASLTHGLGLVILFSGFVYLLLFNFPLLKKWLPLGILIGLLLIYIFKLTPSWLTSELGKVNFLFYYRVFLWRNYSLLAFLALIGLLPEVFQKKKGWQILFLFIAIQGILVSFFSGQPFVRYFYIVFPFLILLSSNGLLAISDILLNVLRLNKRTFKLLFPLALGFFIIATSGKFTLFPRKVYSLNEDMQEIPEVDWKKVYGSVEKKLAENPEAILATNWNDLPVWFLGEGKLDYLARNSTEIKDSLSGARIVKNQTDFKALLSENKSGILVIDSWDDRVPEGIREYVRDNLRKELEVDRLYPVQPRYWPVEVFSWGI